MSMSLFTDELAEVKTHKKEFLGQMNGTPSGGCVGNAFMRSETLDNLRILLKGNFLRRFFTFYHSTRRF